MTHITTGSATSKVKALDGSSSHPLQGRGHIGAVSLQAAQFVLWVFFQPLGKLA